VTGAIQWYPLQGSETSLSLTFIFSPTVKGLKPRKDNNITKTAANVFSVTTMKDEDHFGVITKGNGIVDPKIIVTPQTVGDHAL
jgi:hypothetical protein